MLVPLLLFAIFAVIVWKLFVDNEENPVDMLPGPPGLPFIGNIFMLMNVKPGDLFTSVLGFTKQYGERYVFKVVNKRILHINNPADVEYHPALSDTKICAALQCARYAETLVIKPLKPSNVSDYALLIKLEHSNACTSLLGGRLYKQSGGIHPDGRKELVLSHSRNITKSLPYTFLESWLGTGLLLSTGSKWHKRRKILTPTFHFNILKNFATVMEEKSRDLIVKLRALNGADVDLLPAVSDFTLFTICETAMGTQLDSDKSTASIEYKKAILEIGHVLLDRLTKFWLHNEFVFRSLPSGKKYEKYLGTVHSFADNVILDKKKKRTVNDKNEVTAALVGEGIGSKKRLAMLDLLLEAESKGEIDVEGIREEVNTFMFEGHDTTAMAITFCLMLLADHDDVQDRVFEECTQVLGDSDRTPDTSDLAEMKYLDAVIKETLRLYPSVPFIGRDITEDFMMGDILVKKGTEVSVHIYDIHHREDLYPDPEVFKPDRFLNGETRHPYAYVPFSAGPRNCIGQRFAMQEMKCVVSEICRHFRLVPLQRGVRPALVCDMVLRPADPIYVKFVSR